MDALIGIFQGIFGLAAGWWGYSYYSGRLKFEGHAEERRRRRVTKFGPILLLGVFGCIVGGLMMIVINLKSFF